MLSIRVSATDIDALRYFLADEEGDLAELLAQLRRQTPPTPAMLAGTAFHKALESFDQGFTAQIEALEHTFNLEIDDELDLPALREMKASREYVVDDVVVTLVGKVDAVLGKRIDDHKLTSSFDAERFMAGYQWRIYLEVFGADEFRWNVFEGAAIAGQERVWKIRSLNKLTMHRYPGMGDDIAREVAAFVHFAKLHLPEKFERIAA
jgi:uncharacterized protein YukE